MKTLDGSEDLEIAGSFLLRYLEDGIKKKIDAIAHLLLCSRSEAFIPNLVEKTAA